MKPPNVAIAEENVIQADYVVFSAPPTANPDYDKDVAHAATKEWTGKGQFVFTASGGVYAENSGGSVDEESDVKATSDRSILLLASEKVLLSSELVTFSFKIEIKNYFNIFATSCRQQWNLEGWQLDLEDFTPKIKVLTVSG